ncbi:hypothetical protein Q1695_009047 [Nippostrongylus brasiliensis]|nr:hypothetical protein Q1695_009047 [Nippostrongylus brasiliensis]
MSVIQPGVVSSRSFARYSSHMRAASSPTLDSTRALPCCFDESGGAMCKAMRTHDTDGFVRKCNSEPDFSLVVCCKTCNEATVDYKERGAIFFNAQNDTSACFDRMSTSYCSRFQSNVDTWSTKRWSCNSEHFRLGFRVCRETCGFCTMDWRNSPKPLKC